MARETENLGLYLADDEDTFQNYVKNQSASMNHNMEILDSYIPEQLNSKVDKVTGKTLSTNDYTDTDKGLVDTAIQPDDYATTSSAGLVKPDGVTVVIDEDGTIHGMSTEIATMSSTIKGGAKLGDFLSVENDVLSVDYPEATTSAAGIMSAADKNKLDTLGTHDYIVEQNASDGIYYRKWNSGYMEIDGSASVTTSESTQTGGGYHSEGVYINLPTTFTTCYNLIMTSGDADLFATRYGGMPSITNRFGLRICSYKTIAAGSHTISFRLVGRWK